MSNNLLGSFLYLLLEGGIKTLLSHIESTYHDLRSNKTEKDVYAENYIYSHLQPNRRDCHAKQAWFLTRRT